MQPFQANIAQTALENEEYRRVLYTGSFSQLVVMNIPPNEEVGEETHHSVEQTLYIHAGSGEAILDGHVTPIGPGDVVVVPQGTSHNFRNTGSDALKITTVYAPPHHIDGRIHRTKAEADADMEDEAFGEVRL